MEIYFPENEAKTKKKSRGTMKGIKQFLDAKGTSRPTKAAQTRSSSND